ncbi:hypothetical protein [Sandaracinus amylolyticus]|uniref:Uncharacterized protein n=1 Tax=Sandaracinus amylolyticus TaxID=927083 RepID=A0A0F6SG91_9BACT|nr:hypothetical protein [Sandaracinus amylolyticus]AKF08284.1 hypothetical protein DB32_005433 [Sandaracinus amylolyticus]
MATAKTTRTKRGPTELTQMALAALELATEHRARIDPRLPAGLRDGLSRDIAAIGTLVPEALQTRAERGAATAEQNGAAARAKELVMAIRRTISSADELGASAQRAWGLGLEVRPTVVKSVLAAGDQIVARAAAKPDEARLAGVLESDLDALRAALATTRGADTTQESRKHGAKSATAARDAAMRRIEQSVRKISAVGQLAFVGDGELAKKFDALVPSTRRKPGKKPDPS